MCLVLFLTKYMISIIMFITVVINNSNLNPTIVLDSIIYSSARNWAVLLGNYLDNLKELPVQSLHDSLDVFVLFYHYYFQKREKMECSHRS